MPSEQRLQSGGAFVFILNATAPRHELRRQTVVLVSRRNREGIRVQAADAVEHAVVHRVDFANDFGVAEYFDVNVFLPDGDGFFRTHFVDARTLDASFPTVQQVTGRWPGRRR